MFLQMCPYKKSSGQIRQRISTPSPLYLNMSHSATAKHFLVCQVSIALKTHLLPHKKHIFLQPQLKCLQNITISLGSQPLRQQRGAHDKVPKVNNRNVQAKVDLMPMLTEVLLFSCALIRLLLILNVPVRVKKFRLPQEFCVNRAYWQSLVIVAIRKSTFV